MPESNVEIMRAGFEALSAGGVEAMLKYVHPDFEVTTPPSLAAEPDTYRGHDGVRRYFDSFYEAMDEVRIEPHEYIAVGERVVVPFTLHARGRSTGIEAEQSAVQVWSFRASKAIGAEVFVTLDEAMAAARADSPGEAGESAG